MGEVIGAIILAIFCFWCVSLISKFQAKIDSKHTTNINSIKEGLSLEDCIKLLGNPQSVSDGYIKTCDYSFHINGNRHLNLYISFDNNWKISQFYSVTHNNIF